MKIPALFAAAVALSACSTATPVDQSTERALTPLEAIDIAKGPTAAERGIEPAKAAVKTQTPEAQTVAAGSGDAICNRGTLEENRSFIICEDGALRKASVVNALSAPHDPDLKIEDIASNYQVPVQIFTGIQSATYGSLVNGNRQAPRGGDKHKAQTGLVQIQGKIYEVYQLGSGNKTGTIFVEKKSGS